MVIAACLKFLNSPENFRLTTKKDVHANVEYERAKKNQSANATLQAQDAENAAKKPKLKQARSFGIAKTDFSSYY